MRRVGLNSLVCVTFSEEGDAQKELTRTRKNKTKTHPITDRGEKEDEHYLFQWMQLSVAASRSLRLMS